MENQHNISVNDWTESELLQFFQFTIENMSDAVYWLTSDGGFAYVNNAACRMLGYDKSEFSQMKVKDFFPPNHFWDWDGFWQKIKEAGTLNIESNHKHRTGEIVPVEVRTTYISFRGNEFVYSICTDIRERKAQDEKLKLSERRLSLFLENNLDAFLLTAPDGRIFYVNPAACKMFGRTAEEICTVGRAGILDLTDPRLAPAIEERAKTGFLRAELTGKRKNGETFPIDISSSFYHTDEGELRTSMVIRDITEKKKAEQQLRENEARLSELNATKDKFFSIISHDLRNPVHSLMGTIQILNEDINSMDTELVKRFTKNLERTVSKLNGLVEDLLNWSLLQMDAMKFNPEVLPVKQTIETSIEIIEESANSKNITLKFYIDKDLNVIADKSMFNSIMQNLLTNAIKFSYRGNTIDVYAKKLGDQIVFMIDDKGVGIEKQELDKLFRIDSNHSSDGTENEKGSGLGLVLCKDFIEKHGGTIRVESAPGIGSRFIFTLPAG
jgi:PAS domain S-box-containing protein